MSYKDIDGFPVTLVEANEGKEFTYTYRLDGADLVLTPEMPKGQTSVIRYPKVK